MNTGIQPSILFFENSGKKTENIQFWDVERDDKGNFSEQMVISVPTETLDETYSLDMRKYQEIEKVPYNNEIKLVRLGDIAYTNKESISSKDKYEYINYIDLTNVKCGQVKTIQKIKFDEKTSSAQRKVHNKNIIWGSVRPLSRSYAYLDNLEENTIVSVGFVVIEIKSEIVLPKYVYYVITSDKCVEYLSNRSGGSLYPKFKCSDIEDYMIPVPSLEVQAKIVAELDSIYLKRDEALKIVNSADENANALLNGYIGV